MRYKFMRFPGGKLKAVTLSYDDGIKADLKLCEILNKYGLKCTFNINSGSMGDPKKPNKLTADEIKTHMLDMGHEIAVHGESHIAPGIADPVRAITDVLNCRRTLECEFGIIVRGMAYPDTGITRVDGSNTVENIAGYLKNLGIVYSRTLGGDNDSFMLPDNWYAWMPTAHHNNKNLMEWAEKFVSISLENTYLTRQYPRLFYLWGHSYEFDNNDNWSVIEEFAEKIGKKTDTWYATNMEIYEYTEAYKSLVMSADCTRIYNPTMIEVFISVDTRNFSIKPGETIVI
ncbi:MAG: polysaccharide deacetylase family protein [Clostridia bacterium]|nr:polysaccharide deacetylase family protein [Clostridia bacterium]